MVGNGMINREVVLEFPLDTPLEEGKEAMSNDLKGDRAEFCPQCDFAIIKHLGIPDKDIDFCRECFIDYIMSIEEEIE